MGAQRQTLVNEVATFKEAHFLSLCLLEFEELGMLFVDLVMVFHKVVAFGVVT